ncbi:hypothetical protein ACLQ18_01135 [Streptomyces sp. DT193]|uniref:hypothetical protein n=1 Tax=Streptomyces sp. DT193 TaxID=3393418 RepID=UPI003CF2CCF8
MTLLHQGLHPIINPTDNLPGKVGTGSLAGSGGLRPSDGQALTMTASSRNSVFCQQFLQQVEDAVMTGHETLSTELNPLRIDVSKHLVEHYHRLLREIGATHLQIKVDIETRPARPGTHRRAQSIVVPIVLGMRQPASVVTSL